jgi:hypothetical protein
METTTISGLIFSRDREVLCTLNRTFHEFHITAEVCLQPRSVSELLKSKRFDVIVLDFAESEARTLLRQLRQPSLARCSQVLAIVNGPDQTANALEEKASMTLQRPLKSEFAARCVRSLYGTVLQERRATFRHALQVGVNLQLEDGGVTRATLQNISEGGMGVKSLESIAPGTKISCDVPLPVGIVHVFGQVAWVGAAGQLGIQFIYIAPVEFLRMREWLMSKFEAKFKQHAFFPTQPIIQACAPATANLSQIGL